MTASVAYSKPAWTGDNVRMGGPTSVSSYTGGKRGWHIITGAGNVTAANINAFESHLRAQSGT